MGPQGPQGPGADGWINRTTTTVAVPTTPVTLATLNLPAGSYLLSGKVSLVRTGGGGTSTCTLNDGATVLDQLDNQTSTSGELTVLQSAVTLTGTTAITVRCSSTSAVNASFRVLSAYKLNSLTQQ